MSNNETPVWRVLLSIIFAIFMVGRLAYRCSNMSSNQSQYDTNTQQLQNAISEMQSQNQKRAEEASKNLFYKTYKELDKLQNPQREIYGIKKIEKDSSVLLDLETKIVIPKKSFFMNNHDDSLRFVTKFPNNETFWIHDFESSDDLKTLLKSIKGNEIRNVKETNSQSNKMKTFEYELVKNNLNYNGFAFGLKDNGNIALFELESNTKTKAELQTDALTLILKFLK